MKNQTQLTPEELQELRQVNQDYQTSLLNLGLISVDINNMTKERDLLHVQASQINEKRLEVSKKLGDKYGDKQVNLETGELE